MSFPVLENYLNRLSGAPASGARIRRDPQGRAQGRYFKSTLTSIFQPILRFDGNHAVVAGYEGFVRSYSASDDGLSLWKLLDHAASDDESIELDRLCRLLHALNFFRQPAASGKDLYLNVHGRLLAAVNDNHGAAFANVLSRLELPLARIVLQLPEVSDQQKWLLNVVADNYLRNGFRIAIKARGAADALRLLDKVQPNVVKVNAGSQADDPANLDLIAACRARGISLVFKRIESQAVADRLRHLMLRHQDRQAQADLLVQGLLWGWPDAQLREPAASFLPTRTPVLNAES